MFPAAAEDLASLLTDTWIEDTGYGTLTLYADGTAHMEYYDGTCDFIMAGMPMEGLNWGLDSVAIGLTKVDAFSINYYGMASTPYPPPPALTWTITAP